MNGPRRFFARLFLTIEKDQGFAFGAIVAGVHEEIRVNGECISDGAGV